MLCQGQFMGFVIVGIHIRDRQLDFIYGGILRPDRPELAMIGMPYAYGDPWKADRGAAKSHAAPQKVTIEVVTVSMANPRSHPLTAANDFMVLASV
jgi:hypothetical protein